MEKIRAFRNIFIPPLLAVLILLITISPAKAGYPIDEFVFNGDFENTTNGFAGWACTGDYNICGQYVTLGLCIHSHCAVMNPTSYFDINLYTDIYHNYTIFLPAENDYNISFWWKGSQFSAWFPWSSNQLLNQAGSGEITYYSTIKHLAGGNYIFLLMCGPYWGVCWVDDVSVRPANITTTTTIPSTTTSTLPSMTCEFCDPSGLGDDPISYFMKFFCLLADVLACQTWEVFFVLLFVIFLAVMFYSGIKKVS